MNKRFLVCRKEYFCTLSVFKYPVTFSPEFSALPSKISPYLRTDSAYDINTQKMRGSRNLLIINSLCLVTVSRSYNKHRFSMRLSPYQGLKCTESHHNTAVIIG